MALNIKGEQFCKELGVVYNRGILSSLRELNLVRFFRVGKKYMYPSEDVKAVHTKLLNREISIKTNKGYYITIND